MVDRDTEELLELDEIQGDILPGLQKESEAFVGFVIGDVTRFKAFLGGLAVTTARDALQAEADIAAHKAAGGTDLLDIRGLNIAFTYDGLAKLGAEDLGAIKDPAFREGLAARSAGLNDPPRGAGSVGHWKLGNGEGPLDGMLIATGRNDAAVAATLEALDAAAGADAWTAFYVENGNTRPGTQRGHEHFGYLDGVSQPAVRGRVDGFAGRSFYDPGRNPDDPNQGLPGADLHWPGEFVFGYAEQDGTDVENTVGPKDGGPAWMRNGSFMVFRRLEQLVPEFHATAARKAHQAGQDPVVFEARMVGRFQDGAPLSITPRVAPGDDALRNNDFDFGDNDPAGRICPYAAHIRKSYPRNDITPAAAGKTGPAANTASEADTQTHRVMRRGIPFGPEVQRYEAASGHSRHSRGLMFVCYQTSIEDQFEFIIRNWVNNPGFAIGEAGHDPLLGQTSGLDRKRFYTGADDGAASCTPPLTVLERDFIRPTGGGYFFAPSIAAIRMLAY